MIMKFQGTKFQISSTPICASLRGSRQRAGVTFNYTGVTQYRPFKNAKCRKCTRALEAANVAQLVHEAQFGRRSIHLQLAKGPSWRGTAPECSLLVCIAHLAVQACFRLQRHSRVASGPGLCLWAPALRQHLRFDKLSSEVAVSL